MKGAYTIMSLSEYRANTINLNKLELKFDVITLDNIIGFLYKDSVLRTRKAMSNTKKLFDALDYDLYVNNPDLEARLWIINRTLHARIDKGFVSDNMILQYLKDDVYANPIALSILDDIDRYRKQIKHEEIKYLLRAIDDRLKYGYIVTLKNVFREILDKIDYCDFRLYKSVEKDLYDIASLVININRKNRTNDTTDSFSLEEEEYENVVTEAVNKLKDRNRMLITGIQRLNTILAPAYLGKRLYTYLALPAGGKSLILLKSALSIKKYNKDIKTKDPSKKPAILYLTMENTVDETVERIFNMTSTNDDIRNYTPKQVIKRLKDEGELVLSDDNPIDIIIKYYPNRSINTDDIYTMINDMQDDGKEVIALFLDYLKRIKPAEKSLTEKEELKNITNELKTIAIEYDIPVITAQQLNRTSASVIDAAIEAKKEDITRLIGRDGVGSAWEIRLNLNGLPIQQCMKNKTSLIAGTVLDDNELLSYYSDIIVAKVNPDGTVIRFIVETNPQPSILLGKIKVQRLGKARQPCDRNIEMYLYWYRWFENKVYENIHEASR